MIGRQLLLGAIEGRTPTQMMAGVASEKAYTAGKDLIEDVFFNHKKKLEDKVGGFNKHFDQQIMKQKHVMPKKSMFKIKIRLMMLKVQTPRIQM